MLLPGMVACSDNAGVEASEPEAVQGKPVLLIVLVDSTGSAAKNLEDWKTRFRQVLSKRRLPEDSKVVLVICDAHPEVFWTQKYTLYKKDVDQILAKFDLAWQPRPCGKDKSGKPTFCGTDVTTALDRTIEYATSYQNTAFQRKMIVGWTDLRPDPCVKNGKDKLIRYRKPQTYDWGGRQSVKVELILHGVPQPLQLSRC